MKSIALLALALTVGISLPAFAKPAICQLNSESVKTTWTAFKTTAKTAVSGTFRKAELAQNMKTWTLKIDATSVDSGNPARDTTLKGFFFGIFVPKGTLTATLSASVAKLADGKGVDIPLKLSGLADGGSREIPARVERKGNVFTLTGKFDLLEIGQKAAWEKIHQSCEVLHKGPDGVSKTWSEVEISATAEAKGC